MVMRSEVADGPGDRVFYVKPRVNVISASLTVPALASKYIFHSIKSRLRNQNCELS